MKRVSDRRKNQQRDGIQNKNRAKRYGHLFFIGLKNGADRSDGAAAANGRARSNQEPRIPAHLQEFAERQAHQKRKGNTQRGVEKSAAAGLQDFVEIHPESQSDDGTLQKSAGDSPAFVDVGMGKAEPEDETQGERNGWRENPREGQGEKEKEN